MKVVHVSQEQQNMEQIKGGFKKISLEINVFVDIKNTMDG